MADEQITQADREAEELAAYANPDDILATPREDGRAPVETVSVDIGGRSFEVSPEQKEALELQSAMHQQQITELQQPIAEQPQEENREDPIWQDEFYADPDGTLEKFKADLLESVREAVASENQVKANQDSFWNGFYTDHKELADNKDIVNMVLSTNPKIGDMPVAAAGTELAKLAKQKILSIAKQYGATQESVEDLHLTGAAQDVPREEPAEESDTTPISLSEAIKARRQGRNATGS